MEMFVHGRWTSALSGRTFQVHNPATGAILDSVPAADAKDADEAVRSAYRAYQQWRTTPVADRARFQRTAAALMRERAASLAQMLTSELGRPISAAVTEIRRAADLLDVYAEEGIRVHGEILGDGPGHQTLVTREPLGARLGNGSRKCWD